MALIKWYYGIVSKRLKDSYIYFTKGRNALYGDERLSINLFNFKMVSSSNFLHLGSIPSIAFKTAKKINLKRQYTIDSPQGNAVALHFKKSL